MNEEQLNSRAEYEKEILSQPDSSFLWIKYISYVMESEGIQNARAIAERALRVVNFSNEKEKVNLWTAYLNLEFHFGDPEQLKAIFKRGCSACKAKLLYFKLIDIYRKSDKKEDMMQLAKQMAQKFKQSSKCWVEVIRCAMETDPQQVKTLIQRGLQCLKKKKHVILLQNYGRL